MRDIQLIGNLLWRNAAILALCLAIGLGLGAGKVYRSQTLYQASTTLMLNDKESGPSKFMKSLESFSVTGKLMTEVEVLRSRYLIGKTLDKLELNVPISQSIRGTWRELYQRSPFTIELDIIDPTYSDKAFTLNLHDDNSFTLTIQEVQYQGRLNETILTPGFRLCISENDSYLQTNPEALQAGLYRFEHISRERLIDHYSGEALTVKLLDKEVAIIKVYFRHNVPLKAQHFVNGLVESYLNDFITNKTEAANKALHFISKELNSISGELRNSERDIATFKQAEGITELSLEADDRLKKLRERDMQRTSLTMELAELERLGKALVASNDAMTAAGELGVVSHPECQRALEKLQQLESKRSELLLSFTAKHPDVLLLDDQIKQARKALTETLSSTLASHMAKMRKLDVNIEEIELKLHTYPVAEQQLLAYQRSYSSKQKTYDFLLNKRIEAGIGAASQISFHKVLERASLPRRPIGMGRKVVLVIGAMVGAGLGLMLILGIYYMRGPVLLSVETEETLKAPLLGVAPITKKPNPYIDLATQLTVQDQGNIHALISWEPKTKQTFITEKLAMGLSIIGKKVLLVYSKDHAQSPSLHEVVNNDHAPLLSDSGYEMMSLGKNERERLTAIHTNALEAWIEQQHDYDIILIDTPALSKSKHALPLIRLADSVLTVVRKGASKKSGLSAIHKALASLEVAHNNIIWSA